jgi:hypothetical protein
MRGLIAPAQFPLPLILPLIFASLRLSELWHWWLRQIFPYLLGSLRLFGHDFFSFSPSSAPPPPNFLASQPAALGHIGPSPPSPFPSFSSSSSSAPPDSVVGHFVLLSHRAHLSPPPFPSPASSSSSSSLFPRPILSVHLECKAPPILCWARPPPPPPPPYFGRRTSPSPFFASAFIPSPSSLHSPSRFSPPFSSCLAPHIPLIYPFLFCQSINYASALHFTDFFLLFKFASFFP